jgi:hypothetical protein
LIIQNSGAGFRSLVSIVVVVVIVVVIVFF